MVEGNWTRMIGIEEYFEVCELYCHVFHNIRFVLVSHPVVQSYLAQ